MVINGYYICSPAGSDCGIVNVNIPTSGAEIGGAFGMCTCCCYFNNVTMVTCGYRWRKSNRRWKRSRK